MQPHIQPVRRGQAHLKSRGGDITSTHEDTLANQKLEEKWKWQIMGNGSTTTTTTVQCKGGVICVN